MPLLSPPFFNIKNNHQEVKFQVLERGARRMELRKGIFTKEESLKMVREQNREICRNVLSINQKLLKPKNLPYSVPMISLLTLYLA
jgi:hypothetical protein